MKSLSEQYVNVLKQLNIIPASKTKFTLIDAMKFLTPFFVDSSNTKKCVTRTTGCDLEATPTLQDSDGKYTISYDVTYTGANVMSVTADSYIQAAYIIILDLYKEGLIVKK